MSFDFKETMKEATDAELIKIVYTDREHYQVAAILAAEAELAQRRLSLEQIQVLKAYQEKQQQIQHGNATTPLDIHWVVLSFLFPGILQIILSGLFRAEGYDRKATDLVKWTIGGICFYLALAILITLLR
jgi:hypothetical protein